MRMVPNCFQCKFYTTFRIHEYNIKTTFVIIEILIFIKILCNLLKLHGFIESKLLLSKIINN